jgi:hypothetical protein
MTMTRSIPGELLPSHVRALNAAIGASPLARESFEWRVVDGAWTGSTERSNVPAIFHLETGFHFSIEYHEAWQDEYGAGGPSEFRCFRAPGVQGPTETVGARTWDEVLFDFRLWLRLIAREVGHHDVGSGSAPVQNASRLAEVWSLIHPEIRHVARGRLEAKRYAEAVDVALSHVSYADSTSVARLTADVDEVKAIHYLFLASLLRYQIDEIESGAEAESRPAGSSIMKSAPAERGRSSSP